VLTHSVLPLNFLLAAVNHSSLKDNSDFAGKLAAAVLHSMSTKLGHVRVGEMWRQSELEWRQFVPGEQVEGFVASNKLEFTTEAAVAHPSAYHDPNSETPIESIASNLRQRLLGKTKNNEEIFDWVDVTLGPRSKEHSFIRVLMEVVAESAISGAGGSQCELKKDLLTDRIPLFKRYLDGDVDREKQALYSLQHLMHRLEHPNKLLHQIFEALYDADVLSEEAFEAWEKCDNPAEQEGKGVAIKSTTQFFTWLREADEEEDEGLGSN
jgi:translation initiation factor 4G